MIYYEHWIFKYWPMKKYGGITILPGVILVADKKEDVGQLLINHEKGHTFQPDIVDTVLVPGKLDAVFTFWVTYLFSYLWNLAKYRSHWKAYKMIFWERLAREFAEVE